MTSPGDVSLLRPSREEREMQRRSIRDLLAKSWPPAGAVERAQSGGGVPGMGTGLEVEVLHGEIWADPRLLVTTDSGRQEEGNDDPPMSPQKSDLFVGAMKRGNAR